MAGSAGAKCVSSAAAMASRKMRGFKRWMKCRGIDCSEALELLVTNHDCSLTFSVCVRALCDLHEGDVVARIPKESCLTIKASRACHMIEEAGLDGLLGLAVALMYERSLGPQSAWFDYLQLLPDSEPIPLLWSSAEIDSLLVGTELHKIVKEDQGLVYADWKESIQPLLEYAPYRIKPKYFGVEQYFAAKSLIASRSFEIDDYYGSGMVALADLFNHKTGAEDVHFTLSSSQDESDCDADGDQATSEAEGQLSDVSPSPDHIDGERSSGSDQEFSSASGDDQTVLEMIMVKDVMVGNEVYNTYGLLGNAALLHRYGFTETDNTYDIVNLDFELVLKWSYSLFPHRHSRRRLLLWRKLGYSGCESQDSEYFEISFDGEPQVELLLLLYTMFLPEEAYHELDLLVASSSDGTALSSLPSSQKINVPFWITSELQKDLLMTKSVCGALSSLADTRESLYGSSSLEDDMKVSDSCSGKDHKLFYSLTLRISERRILQKLRSYAADALRSAKNGGRRKRLKKMQ